MEEQRSLSYTRAILSNLMPMVVKIVGSTPTARTINESEVVGVLDTGQNKQLQLKDRKVLLGCNI